MENKIKYNKCEDCGSTEAKHYSANLGVCNDCGQFMDRENKLMVIASESGIEKTKAQAVLEQFQSFANQASEWEQKTRALVITDVSQKKEMQLAKSARLNLRDIRVAAEKKKKELKAGILVEGRLIDAMYNFIAGVTEPLERELLEKEKFAERQEAARLLKLKTEREESLAPYGIDTQSYSLGSMSEEAFSNLLDMTKTSFEAKQAEARRLEEERIAREKKDAEEKAERERLDREERAKQAAENARLKAEAEERKRQISAERAKAEAKLKEIEEQFRKEARERAEAERKRIAEAQRANAEAIESARVERLKADAEIRRAREEAEKALRELQENKAEEERIKREESYRVEAERKRIEAAGDKEKLITYLGQVKSITWPCLSSDKADAIAKKFRMAIYNATMESEEL